MYLFNVGGVKGYSVLMYRMLYLYLMIYMLEVSKEILTM